MTVIIGGSGTANGISYFSSPTTFGGTLATASRGISNASIPSGGIIQIQSTTKTDTFSSSSTSFTDITGLSVSITPTSSTSKILVTTSVIGGSTTWTNLCAFRLVRDSTAICVGNSASGYTQATVGGLRGSYDLNSGWYFTAHHLDSPATTSTTTYKVQGYVEANSFRINAIGSDNSGAGWSYRGASTITVMELAQ